VVRAVSAEIEGLVRRKLSVNHWANIENSTLVSSTPRTPHACTGRRPWSSVGSPTRTPARRAVGDGRCRCESVRLIHVV